jgi:malate dehydrogenase
MSRTENSPVAVKPMRVAVAGAAGRVGYSLVFRIAAGGLFGPNQPVGLRLLELPEARPRLEACAMELKDCAYPLLTGIHIGTDSREVFEGADWIILLGGKPLSAELGNRLDLLRANAPSMVEQGRAINQAAPTARVLVVAQPCNTNCLIALSRARDVPAEHWFALNLLPWLRAVSMIAEKTGAPVSQISRVTVWGNNSKTAYVDIRNAMIGDKPALDVINDIDWVNRVMEPTVVARDREILKVRGTTPAGAVAHAILGTVRSITTPTPYQRWFAAGVVSNGSYDVPRGLVFGFPLVTADGQSWSIVEELYVDEFARERIAANVAELEHEASVVSHLLRPI